MSPPSCVKMATSYCWHCQVVFPIEIMSSHCCTWFDCDYLIIGREANETRAFDNLEVTNAINKLDATFTKRILYTRLLTVKRDQIVHNEMPIDFNNVCDFNTRMAPFKNHFKNVYLDVRVLSHVETSKVLNFINVIYDILKKYGTVLFPDVRLIKTVNPNPATRNLNGLPIFKAKEQIVDSYEEADAQWKEIIEYDYEMRYDTYLSELKIFLKNSNFGDNFTTYRRMDPDPETRDELRTILTTKTIITVPSVQSVKSNAYQSYIVAMKV